MSARRHHRVKPGPVGGASSSPVALGTLAGLRYVRPPHVWTRCDYCGQSMTGQEYRGDKCLDCRVRDGEAEVDENGEEIEADLPHLADTSRRQCWCRQPHGS